MSKPRTRRQPWLLLLGLFGLATLMGATAFLNLRVFGQREVDGMEFHTVARGELEVLVHGSGSLESRKNTEIKSKVRGENTITWVIKNGTTVQEGDLLLTLDTLQIEDEIVERSKHAHASRSGADHWKAQAARAKIAIEEYGAGRFPSDLMAMETNLAIAESNLTSAENILDYTKSLSQRGYVSDLDVEERTTTLRAAELTRELQQTQIDVLKRFSSEEEKERLLGDWKAAEAEYEAAAERAKMDAIRRDIAMQELENCEIRAKRSGIVLYPKQHAWKETPDIEEGATVHQEQLLLIMPDLENMQVVVGVHESLVDRVHQGLPATVKIGEERLEGTVAEVSTVARAAGWWTGGVVRYDTTIALPSGHELRPGKSAKVSIVLAHHQDVLAVPTAAIVQSVQGAFVWVRTPHGLQRRSVTLGDTNDEMIIIQEGLLEGDEVLLTPVMFLEEARQEAANVIVDDNDA